MSTLTDALGAIKTVLLLEERITSQARKMEQLAERIVDLERRLATMEGQMAGFLAAAAAFGGGAARSAGPGRHPRLIGENHD